MTVKQRRQLTDEERVERRERDREYARQAVERLRSSEGWRAWLTTRATFHAYSLGNQLLIAMQRPTATRVAGFRAWLKLGYRVSRGETAIRIWAPGPPSSKQLERWRQTGADPDQRPRAFFKLTAVFDTLSRVCRLGWLSVAVAWPQAARAGRDVGRAATVEDAAVVAEPSPEGGGLAAIAGAASGPWSVSRLRASGRLWCRVFVGPCRFGGVVDEHGGEEAVGPFLGEFARVGEHERDGWVADLVAGDEFEQPPGLGVLVVQQLPVALFDDDRGGG
jgi:hypothetical protein